MLTSEMIKQKARELGASVCGIGKIYEEPDPQRDPRQILPNAKCIVEEGRSTIDINRREVVETNEATDTYTLSFFIEEAPEERATLISDESGLPQNPAPKASSKPA